MQAPSETFRVLVHPRADRDLGRLPRDTATRILEACAALADDPLPAGKKIKRLQGIVPPAYRLRIGDYRALYRVDFDGNRVFLLRVVDRRDLRRAARGLPDTPSAG